MAKTAAEPPDTKARYRHLSVRIRTDVYRRAKATAVMADIGFARFVERALLAAMTTPEAPK